MSIKMNVLGEDEWKLVFYQLHFGCLIKCQKVCKLWYKWINDIYREITHLTTHRTTQGLMYCHLYCNVVHNNSRFTLKLQDVRYNVDQKGKSLCKLLKKLTN